MAFDHILLRTLGLAALLAGAGARAGAPQPSARDAAELADLATGAEKELRGDILPFWLKYTRNPANGGYYGLIMSDMTVKAQTDRGALLTSRILWTFSTAYRVYGDPQYLEMARWAYKDLTDHFVDRDDGGLFWSISAAGVPVDAHKQIYGQVFGLYALAEYYRATGDKAALAEAVAIYRLVEAHARDRRFGGYFDSLDRKWERTAGRNLLGDAPKSQNSHIHILEAYSELLRVWPDAGLREDQRALVEVTIRHIINPATHHLVLFMKDDWTPISDTVSYGHDIELSWLLPEAAQGLGDPGLVAQANRIAVEMAGVTLAEGVDPDGSVLEEGGPNGLTNTTKEWWPQAEGVVGFMNAYQLSGDPRFLEASRHTWDFIQAKFVDRVHGDWYNLLKRDGTALPLPKVSIWKCPYHSSRSCFELIERARNVAAGGDAATAPSAR